ncbi:MAG: MarR family transcriptional regulator [Oceanicaulis sp.]
MTDRDGLLAFAPAFFGLACDRLVDRIVAEGGAYAQRAGLSPPVRSMSSLMLLDQKPRTVTELASALRMTHAGAIKAAGLLINAELVERTGDPADRRRKVLSLTPAGRNAARETALFLELVRAAYGTLFEEIGVDLYAAVAKLDKALDQKSFDQRLEEAALSIEAARSPE